MHVRDLAIANKDDIVEAVPKGFRAEPFLGMVVQRRDNYLQLEANGRTFTRYARELATLTVYEPKVLS